MKLTLLKMGFISMIGLGLSACSVDNKWNVNNSWCNEPVEAVLTAETITLSADMLFKYDRSEFADILPEGREQLKAVIDALKNRYHSIKKIVLVGHTDRIGSNSYNDKLGLARATTIKDYLLSEGIETTYVVESQGKREPITSLNR